MDLLYTQVVTTTLGQFDAEKKTPSQTPFLGLWLIPM